MRRFWGYFRFVTIVALLMLSAYAGVVDGSNGVRSASTLAQRVVTAMQLLYGVSALATLVAMFTRRGWVFPLLVVWGVALTAAGAMAPVAYGGTNLMVGAAAGVAVAVVVGLVLWAWRRDVPFGLRESSAE